MITRKSRNTIDSVVLSNSTLSLACGEISGQSTGSTVFSSSSSWDCVDLVIVNNMGGHHACFCSLNSLSDTNLVVLLLGVPIKLVSKDCLSRFSLDSYELILRVNSNSVWFSCFWNLIINVGSSVGPMVEVISVVFDTLLSSLDSNLTSLDTDLIVLLLSQSIHTCD